MFGVWSFYVRADFTATYSTEAKMEMPRYIVPLRRKDTQSRLRSSHLLLEEREGKQPSEIVVLGYECYDHGDVVRDTWLNAYVCRLLCRAFLLNVRGCLGTTI